ncbi:membrane protein BRI3-like [Artemia franciscana]|uniref:membrane protein BRI3-like n=1 Tax=Artemia franciscana TaxID=6661 RepID=UPI0032DAD681
MEHRDAPPAYYSHSSLATSPLSPYVERSTQNHPLQNLKPSSAETYLSQVPPRTTNLQNTGQPQTIPMVPIQLIQQPQQARNPKIDVTIINNNASNAACLHSVTTTHYGCCALLLAIFFFPFGIICCLCLGETSCDNCGAVFRD